MKRPVPRLKGLSKEQKTFVFSLIVAIITLSLTLWYLSVRPISAWELASRSYKAGDTVEMVDRIAKIEMENTTYGKVVYAYVDEPHPVDAYCFYLNPAKEYHVGDEIHLKLHFMEFHFNNGKLVVPREMYGALMLLPTSIQKVIDATSNLSGFELVPIIWNRTSIEYEISYSKNVTYPIGQFNATLIKNYFDEETAKVTYTHQTYPILYAKEYLDIGLISGSPTSNLNDSMVKKVDYMPSLRDSVSKNGTMRFIDFNSNGVLDDGDRFIVSIPPTADERVIQTYFLVIEGPEDADGREIMGNKYLINWYDGIYEPIDGA